MTILNESMRVQEELESRITRAEWKSMDKNERTKLEQQIALNEEKQELYIMRASKTIISILHRGFDKINRMAELWSKMKSQLRNYMIDDYTW